MQSGHTENRLSGSNTPLTPSSSIEPRFPPTPGTTNPSGGVSGGGAQAGSTFPIPSSPQTPTTVTTNPSSAPNLGNYFTDENIFFCDCNTKSFSIWVKISRFLNWNWFEREMLSQKLFVHTATSQLS